MEENKRSKRQRMGTADLERQRTKFNSSSYADNTGYKSNSGGYKKDFGRQDGNRSSSYKSEGYKRNSYAENRDGDSRPRSSYPPRRENSWHDKSNSGGGYKKDFGRQDGNRSSGYKSEGYKRNSYAENRDGDSRPRSSYPPRRENSWHDKSNSGGGYKKDFGRQDGNRSSGYKSEGYKRNSYAENRDGDSRPRSSYPPRRENSWHDKSNSGGGYKKDFGRQDGNRSGGYKPKSYGSERREYGSGHSDRANQTESNNRTRFRGSAEYKKSFVDTSKPMRLNKFLANSSVCSRREADEFIATGVVSVNGEIVTTLGTKIIPDTDKVLFHDQLVGLEKKVYVLLNKPKNYITTTDDPQERQTVMNLVQGACSERIYPVGRLDRATTGVLLLTNDGDLTSKLTHPKYEKKKIYQVKLSKELQQEDFDKLKEGIVLEDGEIKADDVAYVEENNLKHIGIEIHSGRNRIVRRMFDSLGYKIVALDRVYFAGLTKKNLQRGKWRYLSEIEVNFLKMNS